MDTALAIILAGGRGRRLDIFCRHRAKPILPIAGTARVIDFTLSNCVHSLIEDIAVLTDYRRKGITDYLDHWNSANNNPGNLHFLEPRNGSYLGTADAVYQNIDFLDKNASDVVLVLAGDHVYRMDYQRMISFHRQTGADATIAVIPVPIEEAHRFGIVTVDGKVKITDFVEKPKVPQSNLVSMGIYIFDKQILIDRLIEDASLPNSPHDFGHAILPSMIRRDNVAAYKFNSYWRDVGTPQSYYETNMELLPHNSTISLNGTRPVLTDLNGSSPPRISRQARVQNSLVGPGCVINGFVENSVLSPGVRVEEHAEIRNSVVMSDVYIGYHSIVDHCILSEGVNVGRFCYLGLGGNVTSVEQGITLLGDGVTVPPHTAIGRNCKILPHSGSGDFKKKVVPANSILPVPSVIGKSYADNSREEVYRYGNKSLSTP